MAPLYKAMEKFNWSRDCEESFVDLKSQLAAVSSLGSPNAKDTFHIFTDASELAIGAAIHQNGRPLAFYSRILTPTERRYSTFDREALAIMSVFRAYRHWLEGENSVVHTDHKPLLSFMAMRQPSARQARWMYDMAQFHPV